jgi:predicted nucleotidyltransferase
MVDLPIDFKELLEEFAHAGVEVVFMGRPPLRVDFMLTIDGVESERLLANAIEAELDGVNVRVISLDDLIANKRAAGRPQDLIDAEFLERVRRAQGEGQP